MRGDETRRLPILGLLRLTFNSVGNHFGQLMLALIADPFIMGGRRPARAGSLHILTSQFRSRSLGVSIRSSDYLVCDKDASVGLGLGDLT